MSFSDVAPLLLALSPYVVPVVLSFLTVAVRAAFDRMPSKARDVLASIVNTAVAAVEQKTPAGSMTPEQKKALAMQFIHEALDHFHLSVPDSVIEPMLEEAVLFINLARGKSTMIKGGTKVSG